MNTIRLLLVLSALIAVAAPAMALYTSPEANAATSTCVAQGLTSGEVWVDVRRSDGDCMTEYDPPRCLWVDATDPGYVKDGIGNCPLL